MEAAQLGYRIVNLGNTNPRTVLQEYVAAETAIRVVACGGDGTLNWILGVITSLPFKHVPAVGIIPLGTGNDAARHFNWGHKFLGAETVLRDLRYVPQASVTSWDRWHLAITNETALSESVAAEYPNSVSALTVDSTPTLYNETKIEEKGSVEANKQFQVQFNNYLSVGVDGQIMTEFHHHREGCRECYCCRCCTQGWFGYFGFKNLICCKAVQMELSLMARLPGSTDWTDIPIPPGIRGVVVLNLQSYAGGRNIWGNHPSEHEPRADDGLIEIIGIESSFHLSCMVLECRTAVRIGQFAEIKLTSARDCYVQIDGEPWKQPPMTIHARRMPSARMLVNQEHDSCC
jgi:diacylglycerol kinase (ATP)